MELAEAQLLPPGSSDFDREGRELVCFVNNGRYFAPTPVEKQVPLRVRVVKGDAGASRGDAAVIGLQFVTMEPYRWL